MKILNINKNNWSGEFAEIHVFKNKVSLYGVCGRERWESFEIKKHKEKDGFKHFSVWHRDWSDSPIVFGQKFDDVYEATNGGVQRCHLDLHTAIAQVLFNIL